MPFFQLMLISLLWGSSFIFIKTASFSFDAAGIATARAGIAALALVLLAFARRSRWPVAAGDWAKLAALAAIGQIFPFLMLGLASHRAASVDMALMMGAAPLITFLLGRYIPPTEDWNGRAAVGLALGIVGVAVALLGPGSEAGGPEMGGSGTGIAGSSAWEGRLYALLAAAGYSVGALVSRNLARRVDTTMIVTASMTISGSLLALFWLDMHATTAATVLAAVPATVWLALAALGVVNTAVTYVVYFRLIATAGATYAGLNNFLVPPLGLICGGVWLREPVGSAALIGLGLILCGVGLVRRPVAR